MIDESKVLYQSHAFSSIGQYDRAIQMLEDALAEEPSNARLLNALAHCLSSAERFEEAEIAAESSLESDSSSTETRLLLAWLSLRRGDPERMTSIAEDVLADSPGNARAHLYVAMGLCYDRYTRRHSVARIREELLAAGDLAHTVDYHFWAAQIEQRLGDSAAAKAHVAAGLEIDPMDAELLKLRIEQTAEVSEKISILSGLLARNPFDRSSRHGLSELHRRNRLSKYTLQCGLVFWLSLVAGTTDGWWTVGLIVFVWAIGFIVWGLKNNATTGIPESFAKLRASSFRFRLLTSNLSFWWFLTALIGSILLAANVVAGPPVLLVSMLLWAIAHSIVMADDARNAAIDSPETRTMKEVPSLLRTLAQSRVDRGVAVPLGFVALGAVLVVPGVRGGVIDTGAAASLIITCSVAGLVYLVQGLVFVFVLRPDAATIVWSIVRSLLLGGVLGSLLVAGLQTYSSDVATFTPAPVSPATNKLDPSELERRLNPDPQPPFRAPTMPVIPSIPALPTMPPIG
jgi:tetratricopeptide (TPR) repeat protein